MIKVLLIDDSMVDAAIIQEMLADSSPGTFELTHAVSLIDSVPLFFKKDPFDVVLLDLFLPDSAGLDTVKKVVGCAGNTPIVVLTALEDENAGLEAIHQGAQDYLVKRQHDPKLIGRVIRYAIERKKLLLQLQEASANIKTLKGLLPICYRCKKIRNDEGLWDRIETYVQAHTEAAFSHGLCPGCLEQEIAAEKLRIPNIPNDVPGGEAKE